MFCKHCGIPLEENTQICPTCGTDLTPVPETTTEAISEVAAEAVTEAEVVAEVPVECSPVVTPPAAPQSAAVELPPQNRPLSGWAYFGLKLLFAAPIVGFIFLIVFSFSRGNINRRNFARSYWCGLLVFLIILAVMVLIVFGFSLTVGIPMFRYRSY